MINDKFTDIEYWEGIRDACEFFESLGVEDAMQTDLATQAVAELALVGA